MSSIGREHHNKWAPYFLTLVVNSLVLAAGFAVGAFSLPMQETTGEILFSLALLSLSSIPFLLTKARSEPNRLPSLIEEFQLWCLLTIVLALISCALHSGK
jgi:hypothetical protein